MAAKQNPVKKPTSHKKRKPTHRIKALNKKKDKAAQAIARAQREGRSKLYGGHYASS